MGRPALATIGKRLAQLRASVTQRGQAELLGVPERTYQTYEQDTRFPDQRTLLGVFSQGWDLTWVLAGVGPQRVDPRAVIEWLYYLNASPENAGFSETRAVQLANDYRAGRFPVPAWVREELPDLTLEDAREILHGSWHSAREPAASYTASQPVSADHLTLALTQVIEVLQEHGLPMQPAKQAELIVAVAELHAEGLPEARILRFVRAAIAA